MREALRVWGTVPLIAGLSLGSCPQLSQQTRGDPFWEGWGQGQSPGTPQITGVGVGECFGAQSRPSRGLREAGSGSGIPQPPNPT